MTHPFRFGIAAGALAEPDAVVELARRAEALGFSSLAMSDHLDHQLAPLPTLLAAALAAPRLRVTSLVLANDYRHPAVLAKEAATVDAFTGGRLELGIGAGWMRSDYDGAGLEYDRPGVRIARLAEAVAILKGMLGGGPYSFTGEHYRIDGLEGSPPPVQAPHPPILIAGGGRKILSLAAREADIVGLNAGLAAGVIDDRAGATVTPAATDQKLEWIREAAGDRFDSLEIQTRVHMAMITDDRTAMAEALAPSLGVTPADALASPHALVGTVDECVESIQSWRDRWGISYITMSADALEPLAPVVERLAGT